jgi:hypothetical protein
MRVRYVSLFGIALLAVAAVALVATSTKKTEEPAAESDSLVRNNPTPAARLILAGIPSYYTQFSLN